MRAETGGKRGSNPLQRLKVHPLVRGRSTVQFCPAAPSFQALSPCVRRPPGRLRLSEYGTQGCIYVPALNTVNDENASIALECRHIITAFIGLVPATKLPAEALAPRAPLHHREPTAFLFLGGAQLLHSGVILPFPLREGGTGFATISECYANAVAV